MLFNIYEKATQVILKFETLDGWIVHPDRWWKKESFTKILVWYNIYIDGHPTNYLETTSRWRQILFGGVTKYKYYNSSSTSVFLIPVNWLVPVSYSHWSYYLLYTSRPRTAGITSAMTITTQLWFIRGYSNLQAQLNFGVISWCKLWDCPWVAVIVRTRLMKGM